MQQRLATRYRTQKLIRIDELRFWRETLTQQIYVCKIMDADKIILN